jgi:hypothetical protein
MKNIKEYEKGSKGQRRIKRKGKDKEKQKKNNKN